MSITFEHDVFYGVVQYRRELAGLTLAQRVADRSAHIETHTHREPHFVLVTNGSYISSARGAAGPLPLIYNPPGTTHRDRFREGLGSFFSLSISPDRFGHIANHRSTPEFATFLANPAILGIALSLMRECARGSSFSTLKTESLCYELLDGIRSRSGITRKAMSPPSWLSLVYELLHDSYGLDLHVSDLAEAAGVHPVHLARSFRRFFRCTPGDLLRMRRLEKTAELLVRSTRSLSDIAHTCGFTDQSHMTTAFRRTYGASPGKYRRIAIR